MSAAKLQVVGEIVDPKAVEWDRRVSEVIRDFVQLGELLMEGRDNQYYRDLGFDELEDYCKSKPGISWRRAQEVVRDCLVFKAINDNIEGRESSRPSTQEHVRQIGAMANINYEQREVTNRKGERQVVKQPIGVNNAVTVAKQWEATVKEFERRKAKAEKEGKKLPVFSGRFVRNCLPNQYKVSSARGFECNPLVTLAGRLEKLATDMDQRGFTDARKVPVLVKAEPPCLTVQLEDLRTQLRAAGEAIDKMYEILEDYE